MHLYFDPATNGLLDPAIHTIPSDATRIAPARLSAIVTAMEFGAELVADTNGRPRLKWPSAAELRAATVSGIRAEANRRILMIAPLWRQINDLRAIDTPAAKRRFAAIDAIRAASTLVEQDAAETASDALSEFPIANHPLWPEV
ncbi:MAG: hypothetical protein V4696_12905 [Pseudomonadota bacterium]